MLNATSISRPVKQRLQEGGFAGRVLSVHGVVCNLIDAERDVITLMTPSVPYGPFSITLDVSFDGLAVGQPANADAVQLVVGDLTVGLGDAPNAGGAVRNVGPPGPYADGNRSSR